jgi:hypothetical protein
MTPDQQKRANEIFTPEKIIDISKAISNEAELIKQVDSLEKKLKKANDIIETQRESHQNLLNEFSYLTGLLEQYNGSITQTPTTEPKQSKSIVSGFQLSPYLFLQDFNYKQVNFSLNLKYTVKQFYVKLSGGTMSSPELNLTQRQLYSTIGIGYNIFKK